MEKIPSSIESKTGYNVAGPADAFPIVLIHGAAWTRSMWIPQIEALSDEFRVIALDLPGHGVLHEKPFQLATACQVVIESIKLETGGQALVAGLSLGGYVAIACAHAYPQNTAGLLLSGCCIDYRGIIGFLSRLDSSLATTLFSEQRLTRIQEKTLRRAFPASVIEPQLQAGFSWKAMPQVYRELASHDFVTMLQPFPGPVLIVNGENDRQNRKKEAELLGASQDGQISIIEHANHLCNLEQPEAFTHQVRTFARMLSKEPEKKG